MVFVAAIGSKSGQEPLVLNVTTNELSFDSCRLAAENTDTLVFFCSVISKCCNKSCDETSRGNTQIAHRLKEIQKCFQPGAQPSSSFVFSQRKSFRFRMLSCVKLITPSTTSGRSRRISSIANGQSNARTNGAASLAMIDKKDFASALEIVPDSSTVRKMSRPRPGDFLRLKEAHKASSDASAARKTMVGALLSARVVRTSPPSSAGKKQCQSLS